MMTKLLQLDADWTTRVRVAEKPGPLRTVAAFLAHSGDSWFWGVGLALLWVLGDAASKTFAVRVLVSIAITAVVVFAIKFAVKRQRPPGEWGGIYRQTDPHSFPSGHAARALMLAVVGGAFGPTWLALGLWIWAPLVALARAAMGVHYLSDVVAGAVLGLMLGAGLVALLPLGL